MPGSIIEVDMGPITQGLGQWIDGLVRGFEEGVPFAVDVGFQVSQERVPVRTGKLKSSGHVEKQGTYVVSIVYSAGYAGFVELGTSHNRSQPFCQPAFDEIMRILPSAIKERAGV